MGRPLLPGLLLPGRDPQGRPSRHSHRWAAGDAAAVSTNATARRRAAIVDRVTCNATLIEAGTESYRQARTKANKSDGTKQSPVAVSCTQYVLTGFGTGCQPVSVAQSSAAIISTSQAGALICP
jgi:hypothetical protein